MKKQLLIILLFSLSLYSYSQLEGQKGFTGGILTKNPSEMGTILFKSYLSDGKAIRLGAYFGSVDNTGLTMKSYDTDYDNDFDIRETTVNSGSLLGIELGYQSGLLRETNPKLEPYFGAALAVAYNLGVKSDVKTEYYDSDEEIIDNRYYQIVYKEPQQIALTIKGFVGFNYYFTKNLAFGAEYGFGYHFATKIGEGEIEETTKTSSSTNTNTYKNTKNLTLNAGLQSTGALLTFTWLF